MVDHIVLGPVGAGGEAGVAGPVDTLDCVLVEDTAVPVFLPGLVLHWVVPDQFEQA